MPATFLDDEPTSGVTFLEDEPAPRGTLERAQELGASPYSDSMTLINPAVAEMTRGNEPITPIPAIPQQEGLVKEIGAGAVNSLSGLVNSLQTPTNIQLAPVAAVPGLGRVIGALFGVDMARHIPEQVESAIEAPTVQGKIEGFGGATLTAVLAGLGLRHAVKGLPAEVRALKAGPPAEAAIPEPTTPATASEVAPSAAPANPISELLREDMIRNPSGEFSEEIRAAKEAEPSSPASAEPIIADATGTEAAQATTPEAVKPVAEVWDSLPRQERAAIADEAGVPHVTDGWKWDQLSDESKAALTEADRRLTTDETPITSPTEPGRVGTEPAPGEVLGEGPREVLPVTEPKPVEESVRAGVDEPKAGEVAPKEAVNSNERFGLPEKLTPMSEQYLNIKRTLPKDAVVLTRLGDFYEAFGDDAVKLSKGVNIALTKRGELKMSGVPYHAADKYVGQMLEAGHKVALIEDGKVRMLPENVAPEIMSPGPGAASAKEPLASYEQRRFGKRFQEDENISPEIREQTGNQYYEPISNVKTVAEAEGLIEDYGTDTSLRIVRDEAAPLAPRVRVTMGQALIKKLNQSHEEAKLAGDPRATEFLNQAVDTAEYLSEVGTTLGQGVQAFAIWNRLSPEGILLEATRIAKKTGAELTPEQTSKIAKLTGEIEKAPEGFQKGEKTMELMNFMADMKGANPADIPTALWYSNILSGYSTQLVNTIDTGINVLAESAAMATSHPSAVPQILSGLYQGMIKGGFEAANVLKTGKSPITGAKVSQQKVLERTTFGKEGGVPVNPDTKLGRFMKAALESKPAAVLNLWKYPLRAMVASDTVFFNSMKEARARFLARGLAKKEGLSGDALFERVDQILNEGPGRLDAAMKQAQEEGLSGINERRRVNEIIEQGRPEELVDNATEAAEIATYNHEPSGVLGLVANNISNITQEFPLGKAIVPFTRIVANVANRGLNYTPWGYKRLFFGEWGGKKFGSEPPTGEAFRSQLVKATLGTTAMTTVALLDASNKIQVTASGPADPDERKQLQNTGWKPYSVKIGDTWYSYQYTPFNIGFAMVGHYRDAVRYNKLNEKDAGTRLAYGMMKSGSTIFDMSFLSGISDFIETVQGTASSTKGAGRLFSRTVSSVVVPNLVKQIDKLFDPTTYQGDTVTQGLIRETPVARSFALKPMLNVLGEPVKPSQNRFFTSDPKDPVWSFIVEKQAWVPVPSKTTKIGNRPIKPDEYYELIEKSGPQIRQFIQSNLGRLRGMSGEQAQKEIREESEKIRTSVKKRFR